MSVLADVSGPEAVRAFRRAGCLVQRQSGSHVSPAKHGVPDLIVSPVHGGRAVKRSVLLAAIRTAGLTPDEFRDLQ